MTYFRLTVKNYRCFTEANPLVIEFNEGFTALVGPNNSGKSSFLKMFYEFKNLWQILTQEQAMLNLVNGESQSVSYLETSDDTEIFSNFNNRPLSIGFDQFGFSRQPNTSPQPFPLLKSEFIAEKNDPRSWKGRFKYIDGPNECDLIWKNKNRSQFIDNTLRLNPSEHQKPPQHFEFFPIFESLRLFVSTTIYWPQIQA